MRRRLRRRTDKTYEDGGMDDDDYVEGGEAHMPKKLRLLMLDWKGESDEFKQR